MMISNITFNNRWKGMIQIVVAHNKYDVSYKVIVHRIYVNRYREQAQLTSTQASQLPLIR